MTIIDFLRQNDSTMRQRFHVSRIGVFGSFARGEETETSDLDILVEFEQGRKTFDNYMDLKFFIEDLVHRPVDLVTTAALKPRIREEILREVVYA
jgi:predicted nucleotidyltransferase